MTGTLVDASVGMLASTSLTDDTGKTTGALSSPEPTRRELEALTMPGGPNVEVVTLATVPTVEDVGSGARASAEAAIAVWSWLDAMASLDIIAA